MSEFKALVIDRQKIDTTIEECFNGCRITNKRENRPGDVTYTIDVEGSEALLTIYSNTDGTTSIAHNLGKKKDLSLQIAQVIKDKCGRKEININSFYIKKIAKEDLNTIFEFLAENGAEIGDSKSMPHGTQRKVIGKQGDILTFSYFTNDALQIQGKPVLLFNDTIEILSELLPFKEIIEQQLKYYSVNLTTGDIMGEMENRIPNAFPKLHDKIKAIISPSIALRKIKEIELMDYSSFVFPVLRGLEAIIKQLLSPDFIVKQDVGFKPYFLLNFKTQESYLNQEVKDILKNPKKCLCIEKAYNYYKFQRHRIFHADSIAANITVLNHAEALQIINASLNIIDEIYLDLSK
ncbi:MAG: type II toxin-antitoxin system RnlA family toxin [Bacteroidota bacterium]